MDRMILTLLLCVGFAGSLAGLGGVCWRVRGRVQQAGIRAGMRWLAIGSLIVATTPTAIAVYLVFCLVAGQPPATEKQIRQGVTYHRRVILSPRRAVIHIVEIANPQRTRLAVTPAMDTSDGLRNLAGIATEAVVSLDADILINANFFAPFKDNWFLDYRPHAGEPVEPIGPVVSDGQRYGRAKSGWPSFWQTANGRIGFGDLPDDAANAVTGRQWLVRAGRPGVVNDEPPYPRTAVATDAAHGRLWLIVVDGKQPRYSEGLTLNELSDLLAGLGASDAIELDGGGSSIMVHNVGGKPVVLSRPCHTKIPGRQRPTGVFLGITLPK